MEKNELDVLLLDPFCFHTHWRSRFESLGGTEPSGDPSYVFHTEYVDLPLGAAQFRVGFDNLRGSRGSITFIVHAFDGQNHVVRHFETMVAFQELLERKGRISFGISAYPGRKHALIAHSYGEMDGTCTGISVQLIHKEPIVLPSAKIPPYRAPFNATSILVSKQEPVFAKPVSQACTPQQLNDPHFKDVADSRRLPDESDLSLWRRLMPYQILDHYNVLRPGISLLQLGTENFGVTPIVADQGGQVVELAFQPSLDNSGKVEVDFLPSEFVRYFDVILSSIEPIDVGSIPIWSRLVLDSALCLREGGVAIYPCEVKLNEVSDDRNGLFSITRHEMEKLCLKLISRKIDVAEIKYGSEVGFSHDIDKSSVPFYLIISRSIS